MDQGETSFGLRFDPRKWRNYPKKLNENNSNFQANGSFSLKPNRSIPEPEPYIDDKSSIAHPINLDVEAVWNLVSPEGRKRSTKSELTQAYSKALKKISHEKICSGVRGYYQESNRNGVGHMGPHRLIWDCKSKDIGRIAAFIPKPKSRDGPDLSLLRSMIKVKDQSTAFIWPEERTGMSENEARAFVAQQDTIL